jgi:uncharacterized membrane protein
MNYKNILNKIVNGLILFLFPLIVIIFVIEKAIELIHKIIDPIKHLFPEQKVFGIGIISLLIFCLIIFICYLIGSVANHKKIIPIITTLDELLSTMIPTYHIIKTRANDSSKKEENWKSILVAENNDWVIAFEIEQKSENYSLVYFPNFPDSKNGKLKIVERKKIKYLDISSVELQNSIKKYGKGIEI